MNAIAALTLLADAVTAFSPTPTPRLAAGAEIIRPVAESEAPPFEFLGGATPMHKGTTSILRLTGGAVAAPDTRPARIAREALPIA